MKLLIIKAVDVVSITGNPIETFFGKIQVEKNRTVRCRECVLIIEHAQYIIRWLIKKCCPKEIAYDPNCSYKIPLKTIYELIDICEKIVKNPKEGETLMPDKAVNDPYGEDYIENISYVGGMLKHIVSDKYPASYFITGTW